MDDSTANIHEYRKSLEALPFGKRVGTHLYIHKDGIGELNGPIKALVDYASRLAEESAFEFNIIKAGTRQVTISLLNYPGFWRQAFPVLSDSAKLNLESHELEVTDFHERKNRPILHRKELLLPPEHRHFEKFAALTCQAEALGLFKDPKKIGLENGWRKTLRERDVKIVGHTLQQITQDSTVKTDADLRVDRHKTAMRRQHLSQPMQIIQKYGYLNGDNSVFDYGCGRGDDVQALRELSIQVDGWDPHFRPNNDRKTADIVNIGYVVNVIESREERDQALLSAFGLAKKFLVVSALIGNPDYSGHSKEVRDGVITSIGTFQKYYGPDELENYVRGLLKVPVVPVAQGVVLAFQSEEEADRFRARRVGSRRVGRRGSLQQAADLYLLDEHGREVLTAFWDQCLELGREPLASELSEAASLEPLGLSPSTAFKYLSEKLGHADIERFAQERRQDMLIQFALGQFDGRVYYKYLSDDVRKDINVFFGGFSQYQEQAKELLFSISDTASLKTAALEAAAEGYGYMLTDEAIQLHISLLTRLPPILQVYVGCALRLVGGPGRANLIKIHLTSGKVSLMTYDDFDGQAIPHLVERIKVNLWARRTDYFDYIAGFAPPPLLMKSLFLPEDYAFFEEQARFDGKLMKEGIFEISNPHPSRREFEVTLKNKGMEIRGFDLIRATR